MNRKKIVSSSALSIYRKAVIASASVTREKNSFHSLFDVDVTDPRNLIREHFRKTGEKKSFTAYIVTCLAQVIRDHPDLNSFIRGKRLYLLKDVTISVLIERDAQGEKYPEPIGIRQAQLKTVSQIEREIRLAMEKPGDKLGTLSDQTWIRLIPGFLLKIFIRLADRNIRMAERYGKVAVTAIGMFTKEAVWFVPHGSATVLLTIGSINKKVVELDGSLVAREHLCLTASFDHNIVDGAPASRFINQLAATIKSGLLLRDPV
jgi:pyruvate/2-oxoglutarate dehydrogenase complex dihydrolipoamide acyltransferase (E2) component